jgi:hypothetical protein
MRHGLTAAQAAQAVGVPRASFYRWEKRPEPRSKRPRRLRARTWSPALVKAVERLRLDHPMWGRAKLGPLLRRQGFVVSDATAGRIIAHLVARGVVEPVPLLRRRKGGAARAWTRRRAIRLPKGHKATAPGELVQVDALSMNLRPDRAIKQFTAYDPVARHTAAQAFSRATATCAASFLDKLVTAMPFPIKGIQSLPPRRRGSTADRSSWPVRESLRVQEARPLRAAAQAARPQRRRRADARRLALRVLRLL